MRAVIRHSDPAGTGEKIRAAMQEKKWTVLELAEALSYSVRAVYLWLEGKQMPGFDTIFRLAELFDMSLDDLVARSSWTA